MRGSAYALFVPHRRSASATDPDFCDWLRAEAQGDLPDDAQALTQDLAEGAS